MITKLAACGFLVLMAACATPTLESASLLATEVDSESTLEQEPAGLLRERMERTLAEVNLTFFDSETLTAYSASGPYRFVRESQFGMEFEGYDEVHATPARITIFEDEVASLWAHMRVADREFLARLH